MEESKDDMIYLPFSIGTLRTTSAGDFLEDLFLSSTGTIIMTFVMLIVLFIWRTFIDDSEDHEQFVEQLKEAELTRKWDQHNAKWGTDMRPPKKEEASTRPLPKSTVKVIATVPWPTTVTILGDLKTASTILLTYHDIGLNHRWCFNRLINCMNGIGMLHDGVAVVHVDAPGHEDGAPPLQQPSPHGGDGAGSIEGCAQQLQRVLAELGLGAEAKRPILGLGSGAGANVLLRYAADRGPSAVKGLVLLNPSGGAPTRCEALSLAVVRAHMGPAWLPGPLRRRAGAVEALARHHFSKRALACKSLPRAFARSHRKPAEWDNKQWLVAAYARRDPLDAQRLARLAAVPLLCFSAHESAGVGLWPTRYLEEDADDLVTALLCEGGHTRCQHMRVRGCGAQLAEERAEELLQPLRLFAAGLGLTLGR